jgi:phage gp29-like protein
LKTSRKPKALAPATQTATQITPQRVQRSLQARYNPIAQLTPAYLTSSLDLFAQGYLGQFARLADAIERRDDKIAACRRKRISAVARYGFEILTADVGEDKELAATAEQHKEVLEYFYGNVTACNALDENQRGGFALLARQMADAIGKKYAVHEIVMKPGDGAEDGGLTAELRFCPLWFFENRTGKLRFLDQDTATEGKDMSAEQWLVTVGDGIMEACAVAYLYKRLPLQDWLSYTEKFGMPGLLGKTPATPGSAEWNAMESAVGAFMNDWAAVVNQGAEISLVEASAGGGQNPFEPLIERMDRAIAILWRGADLSTMSAGNGEGQGASVQGGEGELLEQDDAAWLAETMQMQLSRLVIEYHFGKGVRPLAYITIKTRDDGDTRLDIEVLRAAKELGIPIAVKDARERLGLVTPDEGEELLGKPEPKDGTAADAADAAKKQEEKAKQEEADALANERGGGADSPVLGKLLAKARHSFPAALARDLQPLKAALAAVLHGDDAGLAERAAALDAKLRDPAFVESLITSAASSTALFEILSAATAQGLSTSH